MPSAWWTAQGWDEYFTVIQWDQRGAGKTYALSNRDPVANLNIDRMQSDAEEVVQWARSEFHQDKIFVLGHSWGSALGLKLAYAHPEWLHAYIGVGQGIDVPESERRGWRWTMEQARAAGNQQAIRDLESIAPYFQSSAPEPLAKIAIQRRWLDYFGGAAYRRTGAGFEAAASKLAPEYSDADLERMWKANDISEAALLPAVLALDFSYVRRLQTPLVLFLGRHDVNVSATVAAEWFATVDAPSKQLVWFEQSGHELLAEEPGKALLSLVNLVRPLARAAGDSAR